MNGNWQSIIRQERLQMAECDSLEKYQEKRDSRKTPEPGEGQAGLDRAALGENGPQPG